jgi:hypothetical protein
MMMHPNIKHGGCKSQEQAILNSGYLRDGSAGLVGVAVCDRPECRRKVEFVRADR